TGENRLWCRVQVRPAAHAHADHARRKGQRKLHVARSMRIATVLTATLLAGSAALQAQGAPTGRCRFVFDNTPATTLTTVQLPSKQYNSFLGHGVVARCPQQKIVLRAD